MKRGKYATGQAPANSTRLFDLSKKSAATLGKSSKTHVAKKLESASSFEHPKRSISNVKASRYTEYEPPLIINVIDLDFQDDSADYDRFLDVDLDGGWND